MSKNFNEIKQVFDLVFKNFLYFSFFSQIFSYCYDGWFNLVAFHGQFLFFDKVFATKFEFYGHFSKLADFVHIWDPLDDEFENFPWFGFVCAQFDEGFVDLGGYSLHFGRIIWILDLKNIKIF